MRRKILVLFEAVNIRKEVIRYSTGLAKRTDSDITVLIILHPNFRKDPDPKDEMSGDTDLKRACREALEAYIIDIEREGVRVTTEVCIGDPSSEFLKFLAKNPPFQTVVWGGVDKDVKGKSSKIEDHWLGRAKNIIHCPLVVPLSRSYER